MYLGEPLQYYQSSNNLPQGAQTDCLCVNLKSCFVLTLPVALLVQSLQICLCINLSCFVSLNTSSRSARCCLLTCLHLNLSCLRFAQHLELLCSFLTCLRPSGTIFIALFCSTTRLGLLVVQLSQLSKYSYFRRTGSYEILSSLPIESPPANVSFTRAFAVSTNKSH